MKPRGQAGRSGEDMEPLKAEENNDAVVPRLAFPMSGRPEGTDPTGWVTSSRYRKQEDAREPLKDD